MPVLLLMYVSADSFRFAFRHFPLRIVTAFFCLLQVLLYLHTFTENLSQKLIGFILPFAAVMIYLFVHPQVSLDVTQFLPGDPVLTEDAAAETDGKGAAVSVESTGEDSMIRVHACKYGTTPFVIRDGEKEYRYILEVYEDDQGHSQIRIEEG